MKHLYATLYLVIFSFSVSFAQNFTIDPDTILSENAELDVYTEYYIYMHPNVDSLYLSWRLVGNTFPDGWTYDLCDLGTCYTDLPNTGDMTSPATAEESGYLKLILNPRDVPASGLLSFWVYETGHQDEYITVHFDISAGTTSTTYPVEQQFEVFPNPTSNELIIKPKEMRSMIEEIIIYDQLGRQVKSFSGFQAGTLYFDNLGLKDGMHTLVIQSNKKTYTGKILVKN